MKHTTALSEVKAVLEKASELVRRIGKLNLESKQKDDGSFVTIVDEKVNEFLRPALLSIYKAEWLSEESPASNARLESDAVWICDPIDGTKELLRGIDECAISVGLVKNNRPILGAIMNPFTGEGGAAAEGANPVFWGFTNTTSISSVQSLIEAQTSVSRSEFEKKLLNKYLDRFAKVKPIGSVAYKLLRTAYGAEHCTFSVQPKSEWDICGGMFLASATGSEFRRFDNVPVLFNQAATRVPCGFFCGPTHLANQFFRETP